ncbi:MULTISPECIES: FMN-dependent NADH-azoreductase [unclassified Halomonas]|jgi:FMN-dependent NADH-azoreductase|uniref:FMN-dependent NADH-azoreductase n=1 Tax=Halomonadaceae TaxID=28256 RepID=UPI00022D3194|nr:MULTISPECIES: NAD(P)H-dependent oxidoreductase [unclassified Halomonas]EHA16872.1 NAD(P)H dehydrogenase (quinone) [Halomonas sp. HAL1]PKG54549.1 NAD(P)H dehydrogenase [Halomonas sp. MES3-P3E]WKV94589.1 NAD(P)H-dependent oxidoreductase [Halomonas sp. HAL1]|tara:strand:- start:9714 stop:10415 length:702 start_codon:yes stop_codon:yes gene_type:complete
MSHILHIDASARPGIAGKDEHGSHSRHLSQRFINHWQSSRPKDTVTYRDIGQHPPSFINHDWIASAFTPEEHLEPWMKNALAESDQLVDELIASDILVIGTPLYNFGMPAALKAWIDLVVRAGRTVDIDESNPTDPYIPKLDDRPRQAIVLTARGGVNMAPGEEMAHMNHLEPHLATALAFIGITRVHYIAIEGQEAGGEVLDKSIAEALRDVETLVADLQKEMVANAIAESA